ncbi:phosphotransferase [Microlunatus speluncae]|uniref:phosphotransferase n=1 Tax=Microlunatus speluncae TaxID=2594267 RepID=UPI001266081C|nr:phosphotransferase [Microlunatus speluncae]
MGDQGAGRAAEPEIALDGGSHSGAVRVGRTVRRRGGVWSPAVLDLLRHLEETGFAGAPRALGFDDQGREVLSFLEGEVGAGLPEVDDGPVPDDHWFWRDDVLVRLGGLVREFHDAAATFPWADREWQLPIQEPVETICHNDLAPWNVIFRAGAPAALIDWEAAAPGPRAWDLGFLAWRWVPFWTDERCRSAGLPKSLADRARRLRLLLEGYGVEPDLALLRTAIERTRGFQDHLWQLVAEGSEWEVCLARRGVLDEIAREIAWVEEHAVALLEA